MSERTSRGGGGPLGTGEIKEAMARSGYPLEVRLWKRLLQEDYPREKRVRASFNPRFVVDGDGTRREVDLEADFQTWEPEPDGRSEGISRTVFLRLLIEAKGMAEDAAFVGLKSPFEPPSDPKFTQITRCYFSGYPSCNVLSEALAGANAVINSPLLECMGPLLEGANPSVQWALVRRAKDGKIHPVADHDQKFQDGLDTLVRAAAGREQDHTRRSHNRPHLTMALSLTALVVPNDRLYEIDIATNEVMATPWLTLHRGFEVRGAVQDRIVDVFEERALPAMIERYWRVLGALKVATKAAAPELKQAGADDAATLLSRRQK
jgi:hypothetical protein